MRRGKSLTARRAAAALAGDEDESAEQVRGDGYDDDLGGKLCAALDVYDRENREDDIKGGDEEAHCRGDSQPEGSA